MSCHHTNIVIVTRTRSGLIKGEKFIQPSEIFVECEECGEKLNIHRITQRKEEFPLLNFND